MTPLPLNNPIIIDSNDMDSNISIVSIWLIDMVQQIISIRKLQEMLHNTGNTGNTASLLSIQQELDLKNKGYDNLNSQERLTNIIDITSSLLGNTFTYDDIKCKLFGAINGFVKDYSLAKNGDFLLQPINYFLMSYNYDGIYNNSSSGNTFARGSVAFVNINMRDQKQDIGSSYLGEGNILFYNGSILNECMYNFDYATEHARISEGRYIDHPAVITRSEGRARSRTTSRIRSEDRGALESMVEDKHEGREGSRQISRGGSRGGSRGNGRRKSRRGCKSRVRCKGRGCGSDKSSGGTIGNFWKKVLKTNKRNFIKDRTLRRNKLNNINKRIIR
jgi:hypothetical protein